MSVRSDGFTVWCDGPGGNDEDWCPGWTAQGSMSKREAVREAKAEGWEHTRRAGKTVDLCPLHRTYDRATDSWSDQQGTTHYIYRAAPPSKPVIGEVGEK